MTAEKVFQGTCIWFDRVKSLGFILPDSGEANVFVYYKNIAAEKGQQYLLKGDRCEYSLGTFKDRVCAVKVKKLPPQPPAEESEESESESADASRDAQRDAVTPAAGSR